MHTSRFDTFFQTVSSAIARRALVRPAAAGALGLFGVSALLREDAVPAKKNKKKRRRKKLRRKKRRCLKTVPLKPCTTNKNCCHKTIKYVCGTSHGAGANTCCGTTGATCSSDLDCCIDVFCQPNGKCAPGDM